MPQRIINDATFHYLESGRGLTIALVHGFPLDCRMWQNQVDALSDRYRVIAPDLRGFGRSLSDEPFTIASLADDLRLLLKELGALPCILGGLSMGGYVALAFARKYASDLRGLMLIDTKAEADVPAARENRNRMIEQVRTSGTEAVADQMLSRLLCPQTIQQQKELTQKVRQIMLSQSPQTIQNALAALRDREDYTQDLPMIRVPTLLIYGEHDIVTPPTVGQQMAGLLPNPTFVTIRGAGHLAPMEQPHDLNTAIRRFAEAVASGKQ